jgi:DNA-binding transcriptional regulator YiaG
MTAMSKKTKFQRVAIRWRKKRGLSMTAAARRLDVPYITWQSWEYGIHEPTGLARALIIARLSR